MMNSGVLFTKEKEEELRRWVNQYYPESLVPADLKNLELHQQASRAFDALEEIVGFELPDSYQEDKRPLFYRLVLSVASLGASRIMRNVSDSPKMIPATKPSIAPIIPPIVPQFEPIIIPVIRELTPKIKTRNSNRLAPLVRLFENVCIGLKIFE